MLVDRYVKQYDFLIEFLNYVKKILLAKLKKISNKLGMLIYLEKFRL